MSRPRFLAITEFGPGNFIYHEGARYQITRVILPVADITGDEEPVLTRSAKVCEACGYLHPGADRDTVRVLRRPAAGGPNATCCGCRTWSTRRRQRINSDEEERQRQGYEVRSAMRFAARGALGVPRAEAGGEELAQLAYGHAANLWRFNLGWRRRDPPTPTASCSTPSAATGQRNPADDDDDADDATTGWVAATSASSRSWTTAATASSSTRSDCPRTPRTALSARVAAGGAQDGDPGRLPARGHRARRRAAAEP